MHTIARYQPRFVNLVADLLSDYSDPADYNAKEGVTRVTLEVPGYKKNEISVEVADDTVTVTAENKERGKRAWARYVPNVDAEKIVARLEDGLLTLEMPCRADALPRRIEIT